VPTPILLVAWRVVAGERNFERLNRRHAKHLKVLAERAGDEPWTKAAAERKVWLDPLTNELLVPGRILSPDYPKQEER
jgi:hypothetical protein